MDGQRLADGLVVRGIRVLVACEYCKEKGRVPGGRYRAQGEVIKCPVCDGTRSRPVAISLSELRDLLQLGPPVPPAGEGY